MEQLQDAGLLLKWSKGSGGHGGGSHGRGGRGHGCGGNNANTASGGSLSPSKSKVDMSRSVVVFARRSHAHMVAVFEPEDVVLHRASYVSTAGGDVPDDVPAAGTKDCTITVTRYQRRSRHQHFCQTGSRCWLVGVLVGMGHA